MAFLQYFVFYNIYCIICRRIRDPATAIQRKQSRSTTRLPSPLHSITSLILSIGTFVSYSYTWSYLLVLSVLHHNPWSYLSSLLTPMGLPVLLYTHLWSYLSYVLNPGSYLSYSLLNPWSCVSSDRILKPRVKFRCIFIPLYVYVVRLYDVVCSKLKLVFYLF